MIPFVLRAETPEGFSASDDWSPSLDGLLAYWVLREQLGEEEFALGATGHRPLVVPELPLAAETWDGDRWWQTSSPQYRRLGQHVVWFHRRFDDAAAMRFAPPGTRRVETAGGAFKAYRNRRILTITPGVEWHAIGDPDAVLTILDRPGMTIGWGGGQGYGRVRSWSVRTADADSHLARFGRPVPESFAATNGIDGMRLDWGIVPPGRLPEHRRRCVMPLPGWADVE